VQITTASVHDDTKVRIAKDQHIQPVQITSTLGQHQEVHSNKNIQHDLELRARIREYDQRTASEGFTQVLTKKQKQTMKKQVLGKSTYRTRAMNLLYWNFRGIGNSDTTIVLKNYF
jgi:hypothetical protein